MHWFSTGLLIALTAGVAAWTGYLLRRVFVVEPADRTTPAESPPSPGPDAEEPTA